MSRRRGLVGESRSYPPFIADALADRRGEPLSAEESGFARALAEGGEAAGRNYWRRIYGLPETVDGFPAEGERR